MKEDAMDAAEVVFMVIYEFEADGRIYTGKGESSTAFTTGKTQTICYDPSDPDLNCTLSFLNSQKYNPNAFRFVTIIIRILIVAGIAWYIAKKIF